MRVLVMDCSFLMNEEKFIKYVEFINGFRKERCMQYKRIEDRVMSLGASLLLSYYFKEKHMSIEDVCFDSNEHGKNIITYDNNELPFNMTHSAGYAAIVMPDDDSYVERSVSYGIDIEGIKDFSEKVVKRFFSEYEIENYYKLNSADRNKYFAKCWTRREAYGKMLGFGIRLEMDEFKHVMDDSYMNNIGAYFNTVSLDNLTISVCTNSGPDNSNLKVEIIDEFKLVSLV